MGTRALTVFEKRDGTVVAVLYRQFDGYLEEHGVELCKALGDGATIVNGFNSKTSESAYNGMGDLAVRVITKLKGDPNKIGNFYLTDDADDSSIDFTYVVRPNELGIIEIEVRVNGKAMSNSTVIKLRRYIEELSVLTLGEIVPVS